MSTPHQGPTQSRTETADQNTGDARFSCNICFDPVVDPVVTHCGHLYCWPCLFRWLEPGMHAHERARLGMPRRGPVNGSRRVCPVCKSPCSVPTLVPIYTQTQAREAEPASPTPNETSQSEGQETVSAPMHNEEINGQPSVATEYEAASTGLRRRPNAHSRAESELATSPVSAIPSRPGGQAPVEVSLPSTPRVRNTNSWGISPDSAPRQGALTHGLLMGLSQITSASNSNSEPSMSDIPRLHHRTAGDASTENIYSEEEPDSATEYLSRLLIMLASFVLFCLLVL